MVYFFTSSLCSVVFRHKQGVLQCILALVPDKKNHRRITPIQFQNVFQKAQGKTHAVPSDKHSITRGLLHRRYSWLRVLDYCHGLKVTFKQQRSWELAMLVKKEMWKIKLVRQLILRSISPSHKKRNVITNWIHDDFGGEKGSFIVSTKTSPIQ